MVVAGIKAVFGVLVAGMYVFAAWSMIEGATGTAGYAPNNATTWVVAVTGAGLIAFVSAQVGVTVAVPGSGNGGDGGGLHYRVRASLFGAHDSSRQVASDRGEVAAQDRAAWIALGVLILDSVALIAMGALFFRLYVRPEHIAVAEGLRPLDEAPEYIATQAKTIIGLILAGAGGIAVGAAGSRQ